MSRKFILKRRFDGYTVECDTIDDLRLAIEMNLCQDCVKDVRGDYKEDFKQWDTEKEIKHLLGTSCGGEFYYEVI